jgi:Ligated ion channel L-glutamate- and glycine-binding site
MLKDEIRKELQDKNQTLPDGMVTEKHVHGFLIALLDAISQNMAIRGDKGFKYKLYLVPDRQFGLRDNITGNWSGMVKEILDGVN